MTNANQTTTDRMLVVSLLLLLAAGCATDAEDRYAAARTNMLPRKPIACAGPDCDLLSQPQHEDMLAGLGADLSPDEPTDPNGDPLPEGHNPLGSRNTSLFSLDELFFAGMSVASTGARGRIGLVDDEQAGAELLFDDADDAWTTSPTKAIAIDLDGDGMQEIVVVALADSEASGETLLRARIVRREKGEYAMSAPLSLASFETSPLHIADFWNGYFQLDAVAADLDGDGSDGLFVAVGAELLQFRYDGDSFTQVDSRTFRDPGGDENADVYVRLAAGDLELNGRDQLVIVASALFSEYRSFAQYWIVGHDLDGEIESGTVQKTARGVRQLTTASPAIADLDGDGVPEIVFAGRSMDSAANGLVVLVMNGSKHAAPYSFKDIHWQDLGLHTALYPLAAADLVGDRRQRILAGNTILRLAASEELVVVRDRLIIAPDTEAVVGDYTGDHRDDFLFVRGIGAGEDPAGYMLDGFTIVHADSADAIQLMEFKGSAAIDDYPTFAFANVDEDSPVVQFRGRELMFGDPTVVAVVAAPPTFAGSGQPDGATAFGRSEATEEEAGLSLGFSVGASVGYDGKVPFIGGAEVTASVEASLGWTTSRSRSIERTISFATGPEEDKVVFVTVPYDVYLYEVVSSPNPEAVGSRVAVSVPREPQTLSASIDFYNQHVRGQVAPIDGSVFSHRIGSPFSYPTRADRDERIAAGDALYSELVTVGVGTGSTTVAVSRSEGIGHGFSSEIELSTEIEGSVGGFTTSVTAGLSFGLEMAVTNTSGTSYEGTVGDIPADRLDELGLYRFGLFSYAESLGGREMLVVNYWVEE